MTTHELTAARPLLENRDCPADVPYSSWSLYARTVRATWRTFGLSSHLSIYAVRRPLFTAAMRAGMRLDSLFYPAIRRTEVRRPVFILGHPRSGTTFLHRLLTQTGEFCVFQTWEILVPSLTLRKLVRRRIQKMIARGQGNLFPSEVGHEGALDEVEEEELLFFHTGNTQFLSCLTPLAFSDADFEELVYADQQPASVRRAAMRFLRSCFQRQIYETGKPQIVAKMNYSAMRIRSMHEAFPDAKFVYVVRSPLETIPSHLTLHRNMFAHLWGADRIPPAALQQYYQRRYRHNVAFYRYLEEVIDSGAIPADQLLVVNYDELREQLAPAIQRLTEFTGLELSQRLQDRIADQAREQKSYTRKHRNLDLESFGLSRERIVQDFDFIFDKYGFER